MIYIIGLGIPRSSCHESVVAYYTISGRPFVFV